MLGSIRRQVSLPEDGRHRVGEGAEGSIGEMLAAEQIVRKARVPRPAAAGVAELRRRPGWRRGVGAAVVRLVGVGGGGRRCGSLGGCVHLAPRVARA